MICTCDKCINDDPVSDEELKEVIAEFMTSPRCSIKGKAAQAAVAALVLRELNFCRTCSGPMTVDSRCRKCYVSPLKGF